jgi:DHA1 family bicyclomycin/chloramphenicol resistance-like MFS transporter
MRLGTSAAALSALLLVLDAWCDWGALVGLVIPLFLFVSATGFIVANSIVGALGEFPEFAGAMSALVGSLQYGTGILGSGLVAAFADGTPRPMAAVIAAFGIFSVLCARWLVPTQNSRQSHRHYWRQ